MLPAPFSISIKNLFRSRFDWLGQTALEARGKIKEEFRDVSHDVSHDVAEL